MNCLFLFTHKLTAQQIEQQYLLLIAMLNFDFKVQVLFDKTIFHDWLMHKPLKEKLMALNMYGIDEFLLLNNPTQQDEIELPTRGIDHQELQQMMSAADFIS
jgi:hypothetical protein